MAASSARQVGKTLQRTVHGQSRVIAQMLSLSWPVVYRDRGKILPIFPGVGASSRWTGGQGYRRELTGLRDGGFSRLDA